MTTNVSNIDAWGLLSRTNSAIKTKIVVPILQKILNDAMEAADNGKMEVDVNKHLIGLKQHDVRMINTALLDRGIKILHDGPHEHLISWADARQPSTRQDG